MWRKEVGEGEKRRRGEVEEGRRGEGEEWRRGGCGPSTLSTSSGQAGSGRLKSRWFLVDKSVEDLVVMLGFWPPLKVGVLVREGVVFDLRFFVDYLLFWGRLDC